MRFPDVELFLDDELIATTRNVRRELQRPELHPGSPLLRGEHPWEALHVTLYGSVMYCADRGLFRMWYNAYGEDYYNQQVLAYAESEDGVHWHKPMLDVRTWPGHERTNILVGPECTVHGPCVLRHPDPTDPNRRLLLLFDSYPGTRADSAARGIRGRWCYAAESEDGLRWAPDKGRPAFAGKADSGQSVVWEPREQRFNAYVRLTAQDAFGQRVRIWRRVQSPDFVTWEDPRELIRPDAEDGAPDVQLQQLAVTRYDGIYIGLLSMFRIQQWARTKGGGIAEGPQLDTTQLVTSRDGLRFTRVAQRAPFLSPREPGTWGMSGFRMASSMVLHGDRVLLYCSGRGGGGTAGTSIGLFRLVKDRFVALTPERLLEEAVVELVPMSYPIGAVQLNAAAGPHGSVRVEVADFAGTAIPGFTRADSIPMCDDRPDHTPLWCSGGASYSLAQVPDEYRGKPVRLRIWLQQARLFALRTPPSDAA